MAQYLLSRGGTSSLFRHAQTTLSSALRTQTRSFAAHARIPEPKPGGVTTQSFLASIGRDAASKVKVTQWEEFWSLDGRALKEAGLGVRDRRYILWCMEKFRQGYEPATFAYPPTPKKKIRGHGPAVQNGKRIRSRRLR